jgi:hypothetical protein
MMYQSVRSMTDFEDARSGMYAGAIIGAFATLLFGGLLILGAIDVISSLGSARGIRITNLIVVGVGIIGTLIFGLMGFSSWRSLSRWQRINERPIMAWGTLGTPQRTHTKINRKYLYDIPLTVAPSNGPPYGAVANWFVPMDLRDFARAGARVVVRIDPEDMNVVLVDWDQTRTSWGLPPPT